MATVNFSVPEKVKRAFNETFAGENKSAVIAGLMQQAVDECIRKRRREAAIEAVLALREELRPATDKEIREARQATRP